MEQQEKRQGPTRRLAPLNLILLSEEDFISRSRACLKDRRLRHVIEVHRASPGDSLRVGLLNGPLGRGRIIRLSPEAAEMEIELDHDPPPPLPMTLILALPRPKMLKRLLCAAASMGVKRIFLINSFRVEKSYWNSPLLHAERMREHLFSGLEQALDTIMPQVLLRPLFKPFAEDELPEIVHGTCALAAHPTAVHLCPRAVDRHVVLAVGPEGGFIPYEIEKLVSVGFLPVSMGRRPLRVETALPTLIGRIC